MKKIVNILNYAIPVLCLINAFIVDFDAAMGWAVACVGWSAHLMELRKNERISSTTTN
jgi:hypothetical protein